MAASEVTRPPAVSQITVTGSETPGDPVTATLTSQRRASAGSPRVTTDGVAVSTDAPASRTETVAPASPASVAATPTRTTCSGRAVLPVNKSVDSTSVIRIPPSSHAPRPACPAS